MRSRSLGYIITQSCHEKYSKNFVIGHFCVIFSLAKVRVFRLLREY